MRVTVDPQAGPLVSHIFMCAALARALVRAVLGETEQLESAYFATLDAATNELWLTLHGTLSQALTLRIE